MQKGERQEGNVKTCTLVQVGQVNDALSSFSLDSSDRIETHVIALALYTMGKFPPGINKTVVYATA